MLPFLSIIDVNISLGQWPTRRSPCDEPAKLLAKLGAHGVAEAWAGHFDGIFDGDLSHVNDRLATLCASTIKSSDDSRAPVATRLIPFAEINPLLPAWEAELTRCHEVHHMPGIRLHPNYHGYKLDHPEFIKLFHAATERNLVVTIAVLMEDIRMMHPHLRVEPVDLSPLLKTIPQLPKARLVLLNALSTASRNDVLNKLLSTANVHAEISMLEGVAGIENLLKDVPLERVLFGSHSPSLYFESAKLKLRESPLPITHLRAITHNNARRLLTNR